MYIFIGKMMFQGGKSMIGAVTVRDEKWQAAYIDPYM